MSVRLITTSPSLPRNLTQLNKIPKGTPISKAKMELLRLILAVVAKMFSSSSFPLKINSIALSKAVFIYYILPLLALNVKNVALSERM